MQQIPLIQNSLVQRFIKKIVGDNVTISQSYRQDLNKILTIFILYSATISNEIANQRGAKAFTIEDLKQALKESNLQNIESLLDEQIIQKKLELKEAINDIDVNLQDNQNTDKIEQEIIDIDDDNSIDDNISDKMNDDKIDDSIMNDDIHSNQII